MSSNEPKNGARNPRPIQWGKIGGYLGSLIGALGWVIGFAVVCLTSGNAGVLMEFLFPAALISLSMGLASIVMMEGAARMYGHDSGMFRAVLWGSLFSFCGTILLLLNEWIAPILERHPRMVETMARLNAVYRVDGLFVTASLAAGAALLSFAAWRMMRDVSAE